jgi:hypothetical protein
MALRVEMEYIKAANGLGRRWTINLALRLSLLLRLDWRMYIIAGMQQE